MWRLNVKRMHRVLSEFNFKLAFRSKRTYIFSLDTSCLCYSIKCQTREFLKLFVHKGTQRLACLVIVQGGCSTCSPKQSHINARAWFGSQAITLFRSDLGLGLWLQGMSTSLGFLEWGYPYHCDTAALQEQVRKTTGTYELPL